MLFCIIKSFNFYIWYRCYQENRIKNKYVSRYVHFYHFFFFFFKFVFLKTQNLVSHTHLYSQMNILITSKNKAKKEEQLPSKSVFACWSWEERAHIPPPMVSFMYVNRVVKMLEIKFTRVIKHWHLECLLKIKASR